MKNKPQFYPQAISHKRTMPKWTERERKKKDRFALGMLTCGGLVNGVKMSRHCLL